MLAPSSASFRFGLSSVVKSRSQNSMSNLADDAIVASAMCRPLGDQKSELADLPSRCLMSVKSVLTGSGW